MNENYEFFWSGPFSQWHPCKFEIDGDMYNCTEQYMMQQKALFFGDELTASKIMNTLHPKQQKKLGREVSNFIAEKWSVVCEEIVYKGNHAKFTQNEKLLNKLLDTKDKTLVDASPCDKIWGIGLLEDDPRAQDPEQWLGLNLLGKVLTKLRDDLVK